MIRLLLDANMSPETSAFLCEAFGYDIVDLVSLGLSHINDFEVIELARRERRILVTFDLDFGAIYRQRDQGSFGAILLRLKDQTVESANQALGQFFAEHPTEPDLEGLLVVIDPSKFRIIEEP